MTTQRRIYGNTLTPIETRVHKTIGKVMDLPKSRENEEAIVLIELALKRIGDFVDRLATEPQSNKDDVENYNKDDATISLMDSLLERMKSANLASDRLEGGYSHKKY
jgi:hypothetical protein